MGRDQSELRADTPISFLGSPFAGERLPPAYDLASAELGGATVREPGDALAIRSTIKRWGYCVSIPNAATRSGPEIAEVTLQASGAGIGVAVLTREGGAFIDHLDVDASAEPVRVGVLTGPIEAAGALVFRNIAASPVELRVHSIESYRFVEPAMTEVLDAPSRSGLRPVPGWNRYYSHRVATVEEKVRQAMFGRLDAPRPMRWLEGLQVVVQPGEELSRALFISGLYEPSTALVLRRFLREDGVFIDVGANTGVFTLLASRWVGPGGHVYAFEPSSREFAALARNVELNALANVTTVRAAVHEQAGTATLRVAAGPHRGQNTLAPGFAYEGVHSDRDEEVPLVTLDQYAAQRGVSRVDAIKIDAEGTEVGVLRGARDLVRAHQPALIVEVNDRLLELSGASREALDALVRDEGYRWYAIDDATGEMHLLESLASGPSENYVALHPNRAADRR